MAGQVLAAAQAAAPRSPVRRALLAPYRGMVHAVREIAREEGFRGFYRGLTPSLLLVRAIKPWGTLQLCSTVHSSE